MAGLPDADSTETNPETKTPLLTLAACPVSDRPPGASRLWGKLKITVSPGSLAFRAYEHTRVNEAFYCNYELNPKYREVLEKSGLNVTGVSEDGGARIVEWPGRFFLGTGFLPQFASEPGNPHPIFLAFIKAALG